MALFAPSHTSVIPKHEEILRLLIQNADPYVIPPFYLGLKFPGMVLMLNQIKRLMSPMLLLACISFNPFLLGSPLPGSEQASNFTYHSNVSEVRLVFFAKDEHNRPIQELQKDDFAVIDDDAVIRNFRSFNRSPLTKLDVVLLIDSSESVLAQFKQEIAEVQRMISEAPWSPEDNLSILTFSGVEAHILCAINCRGSFLPDQLASLPAEGTTPLFDALEVATNLLTQRRQPDAWPVIIVFSDGDDTISKSSFRDALREIQMNEAQVYAVDVNRPGRQSNGTAMLQRFAIDSGGRWVGMGQGSAEIFQEVIDDLHSAHVVTYPLPDSNSEFHSIRILPTHNLKLQFRCRRGYYHHSSTHKKEEGL